MATKILMVCLGNICRSPLAEGILRSKLPSDSYHIDSAGTGHWHVGNPPDSRSIQIAKKKGLDISNLRGRQFSKKDFTDFDYIYVMDNQNYRDVVDLAHDENSKAKVKLILDEIF
uniref:low molecular weight protein-tyrosine-phosphatase n=1 Tax=Flavobacterium sp. TaxID=239 RepID=UPI0026333DBD